MLILPFPHLRERWQSSFNPVMDAISSHVSQARNNMPASFSQEFLYILFVLYLFL